jgi:hypothetical protein
MLNSGGETMLHKKTDDFQAGKVTVAGDFERISLGRGQLLQSLYAQIDCR